MSGAWAFPFWIAHRGGGRLAPENTLAAFRGAARLGHRAFECDVRLSRDGVPFLLHDATLDRTTDGSGLAAGHDWAALARLDAGSRHGAGFAGEPLAPLDRVASFVRARRFLLNIEIKSTCADADRIGGNVADAAATLWHGDDAPPLLSAFDRAALAAARNAAPALPRALLCGNAVAPDALEVARDLGCVAIVAAAPTVDAGLRGSTRRAGLRLLAYTVDDSAEADRLKRLGVDGLITDAIDRFRNGRRSGP